MIPYEHKPHYYETDGMNIIHHSNYIRWFEDARIDLFSQLGIGYDRLVARGYDSPVLGVSCEYKHMVRFGETVCISIRLLAYTGVRIVFAYEVRDKETGEIRCTGESRHCFVPTGSTRPISLKKAWPEAHETFLAELERNKAES